MFPRLKIAAALLLLLVASAVQAQTNLTYGTAANGSISAAGSTTSFTFDGMAGDLVIIRVIPVTSGLATSFELDAPDGSEAALTSHAALTYRLNTSGGYLIKVTGQNDQTGDFVVHLDAQTGISTPLTLGQITHADFEANSSPQPFHFQENPNAVSILTVSASDPTFRFSTAVRDSTGVLVAFFNPETRSAVLTVPAGTGAYDLTLTAADPTAQGLVLVDLESEGGTAAATEIPQPTEAVAATETAVPVTPTQAAVGTEGTVYCHISSNGKVNVRSAPSASSDVVTHLTRGQSFDVIGMSVDGAWFAVNFAGKTVWVSMPFAREIDPCPALPVVGS